MDVEESSNACGTHRVGIGGRTQDAGRRSDLRLAPCVLGQLKV
jgi:hypothetical protein